MRLHQRALQVVWTTSMALSFAAAAWSQSGPCITTSATLTGSGCMYVSTGETKYVHPTDPSVIGGPVSLGQLPWYNPNDGAAVFLTSFKLGSFEAFSSVGIQINTGPFAVLTPTLGQYHGTFDLSFRLGTFSSVVHSFSGIYITDGGIVNSNWTGGPGIVMNSLSPVDPDLPQGWALTGSGAQTEPTRTDLGGGLYRFDNSYDLHTEFTWDGGQHWLPTAPDSGAMHIELVGGPVVAAIPEPGTYALLLVGLSLLFFATRRRGMRVEAASMRQFKRFGTAVLRSAMVLAVAALGLFTTRLHH